MDISAPKLPQDKKRFRDEEPNEERAQQKKMKIESKPLQLVDVIDDCLEIIFSYLNLKDLSSVTEAHSRFISPAQWVFSRRHRKKKAIIRFLARNGDDAIEAWESPVTVFFSHFGRYISRMFINFKGCHKPTIEQVILDNCTQSVVNLELALCNSNSLDAINEPFENVKQLSITKGLLGPKLSQLSIWFPNLVCLKLIDVMSSKPENLAAHFPLLKELVVFNGKMSIPLEIVGDMLKANPQLESLILDCDYDVDFLQSISRDLPHLLELQLSVPDDLFQSSDGLQIHFEHVKKFTLKACDHDVVGFVENMPFVFTNLQELILDGLYESGGQLINFIKTNPGINRLTLSSFIGLWDDFKCDDLLSMVNSLPDLVRLAFFADSIYVDDIIRFLDQSKYLQYVRVTVYDQTDWPNLKAAIETKWALDVDVLWNCRIFTLDRKI